MVAVVVAVFPYDRLMSITVSIVVLLYDNRLVAIAVPSLVTVARPDCYANRPNTYTNLLCSSRHCGANARYCRNYQCKTSIHYGSITMKRRADNPVWWQIVPTGVDLATSAVMANSGLKSGCCAG